MVHRLVIINKISLTYYHFGRHSMRSNDGYSLLVCIFVLSSFLYSNTYTYHYVSTTGTLENNEIVKEKTKTFFIVVLLRKNYIKKVELTVQWQGKKVIIKLRGEEEKEQNDSFFSLHMQVHITNHH